jgi:hypothetical protein
MLKATLKIVRKNGLQLEQSGEFKKNYKVCLAAVQQNYLALKFVDEELLKSGKLYLAAIKQNVHVFNHIPDKLKNDYHFCLKAVQ